NVAQLSTTNTFTATNRFNGVVIATNVNNQFTGAFTGNGGGLTNTVTAANYVYSFDTTSQAVIAANLFQAVIFSTNSITNGWSYVAGSSGSFTASQAGLYLVTYSAEAQATSVPATVTLHVLLGGVEFPGSQSVTTLSTASSPVTISKSFLVNVGASGTLKMELTGSSTTVSLVTGAGSGTTKPSIAITIVRIQ
ncbi:MAG TPA: hypothetical protein VN625_02570, partial [Desulfuromonadaceae bacterium]|nr:hypothetical protein [Desulfuromonadaceae bacterium]